MPIRRIAHLILLITVCFVAKPVTGQEPLPQVSVTQAWQGFTRVPGWIEVEYILQNEGTDWEGSIIMYDAVNKVSYESLVDLPQHSRKSVRMTLFSSKGYDVTYQLNKTDNEGQEIRLPLTPIKSDRVCAYLGTNDLSSTAVWSTCNNFLHLNSLAELPETPMVWDSVDVVIINGISTNALSAGQSTAMLAWVASGGHLLLSGGLGLGLTLEFIPSQLRIAESGPIHIFPNIPAIESENEDIAVSQLTLIEGSIPLIEQNGSTLAARNYVGKGTVDIIGWDVTQVDNNTWVEELWETDIVPATAVIASGERLTSTQLEPSLYDLQYMPNKFMPKIWVWIVFFIIYVFLIGPVTILIIKHTNKPIYAWLLIPGWIIIALVVMSVFLSSTYGSTFPMVHDIAFISMNGVDLPSRAVQGTAIMAPQSRNLSWTAQGYVRPMWGSFATDAWRYEGTPYPLTVVSQNHTAQIKTGRPDGMITLGVEDVINGADLDAQLSFTIDEDNLVIKGELYSEVTLENASLLWVGHKYHTLHLADDVTSLTSVPISQDMSMMQTYEGSINNLCNTSMDPYREPMMKAVDPLVEEPIVKPTCYITGKSDFVPFPTTKIAGAYAGESCIIFPIPCPVQGQGNYSTQLIGYTSGYDNGWLDPEMDILSPYPPTSTYKFILPDYISIRDVHRLSISISTAHDNETKQLLENEDLVFMLWDLQAGDWVTQTLQNADNAGEYKIILEHDDAVKFFNLVDRSVQLQITVPENSYPNLFVPIQIDGIW